jgi:hypothetical protein
MWCMSSNGKRWCQSRSMVYKCFSLPLPHWWCVCQIISSFVVGKSPRIDARFSFKNGFTAWSPVFPFFWLKPYVSRWIYPIFIAVGFFMLHQLPWSWCQAAATPQSEATRATRSGSCRSEEAQAVLSPQFSVPLRDCWSAKPRHQCKVHHLALQGSFNFLGKIDPISWVSGFFRTSYYSRLIPFSLIN